MRRIEKRMYATMIILSDEEGMIDNYSQEKIAMKAGYKANGGGITYAMDMLEKENYIAKINKKRWRVFV